MQNETLLAGFVRISRYLGSNSAYVQGGGGNTSAKLDAERMAVKASGVALAEVSQTSGFADVDYRDVRAYLVAPDADENTFNSRLIASNRYPSVRPSMETGFHAVLDGYVLHSHSVYANVVNCACNGAELLREIAPEAVWLPYAAPGRELTLRVRAQAEAKVFFLANHGVIVRGDSAEAVISAHEDLNERVREHLDLPDFDVGGPTRAMSYMQHQILFPDQVIYTNPDAEFAGTRALQETLAAYGYIHDCLDRLALTAHYLQPEDATFLLGMDAEKYRSKVKS